MEQEAFNFGKNGIIKSTFLKNKNPTNINGEDINQILLSHKKSYGKGLFKYFIGYRNESKAFPSLLCVKRPQMNAYAKYFDKYNKYMNLLVNNKEILETYFEIWNKSCGYEPYLCNGCHDLKQKAINFNDVAIVFVKGINYRIHF